MDTHHASLADLTRLLLTGSELSALMQQVVLQVASVLEVERSAVWELLRDRGSVLLRSGAGWPEETVGRLVVDVSAPAPEAERPVDPWHEQPPLLHEAGAISRLGAVIRGQGRAYGLLTADSRQFRTFTEEETHYLQAAANVLAIAIERADAEPVHQRRARPPSSEEEQRWPAAVETAPVEERQRLARELHDSVNRTLYAVAAQAEATLRLLETGELLRAADSLRHPSSMAREAFDELRLLIFDLRPPILAQAGLVAALEARLAVVEGRADLQTSLDVDGYRGLPAPLEQALYRVAQEGLNNALRHARAGAITIRLRQAPASVVLEVLDDGVGFDPDAARAGGVGLAAIAERMAGLGGRLVVQSVPGDGTRLCAEFRGSPC